MVCVVVICAVDSVACLVLRHQLQCLLDGLFFTDWVNLGVSVPGLVLDDLNQLVIFILLFDQHRGLEFGLSDLRGCLLRKR